MAVNQGWVVRFHYESGSYGGKKRSDLGEQRVAHVVAASNDAATLTAALNNNGAAPPAGWPAAPAGVVLVIDSVGSSSPAQFLT
jgi:hypothetical protein